MSNYEQVAHTSADAAVSGIASKLTYAAAASTPVSWFLSSEFGMLAGLFFAFIGVAINAYFKYRDDMRKQIEHETWMEDYRSKGSRPVQ